MVAKVRVGDIMRECAISRSKATFYTAFGLLRTVGKTDSGSYLYDLEETKKRIDTIKEFKNQRLKLAEIKEELDKKSSTRR